MSYSLEEETHVRAVKQLTEGLLKLGFNLVEGEEIYTYTFYRLEGNVNTTKFNGNSFLQDIEKHYQEFLLSILNKRILSAQTDSHPSLLNAQADSHLIQFPEMISIPKL